MEGGTLKIGWVLQGEWKEYSKDQSHLLLPPPPGGSHPKALRGWLMEEVGRKHHSLRGSGGSQ